MNAATRDHDHSFWAGAWLACLLSMVLLAVTAFQSLATFFIRMYSSDVMLGVVNNFTLFSRATWDVVGFALGLVLLHALLAATVHGLSFLTTLVWPASARSRNGLVILWFGLLLAAILLQNAAWFPRSHMGTYYNAFAVRQIGPWTVAQWCVWLVAGLAVLTVAIAAVRVLRDTMQRMRLSRLVAAILLVPATALCALLVTTGNQSKAAAAGPPSVVIIGIDSLRLQNLKRFGGAGITRHLDDALAGADVFTDTVTPLARTFPSWMSILTGRDPRTTGALFNLVHRPSVKSAPTIADTLRHAGYTTYYVTDEVRFSNVDRSYGFDEVITPPIGAADFLIGRTADLPLSNVLANTALGEFLLDYLHGNRAVAGLYRPSTFIARVNREFEPAGPVFLAMHLTAAHWPYYHADTPMRGEPGAPATAVDVYAESLRTADEMFGQTMQMLREKGVLDNALVVILSDHGEALSLPSDKLVGDVVDGRVEGLLVPPKVVNWGHGQSVLSPIQYEVLLGFRAYGRAASLVRGGRDIDCPTTLQDVFPTITQLVGSATPAVDGVSMAGLLDGSRELEAGCDWSRIRFTETDIRVAPSADGTIDEDQAAAQAAMLFAVDHTTGWLHLRPTAIPMLMQFKERAAIGPTALLAAMPVAPGRHEYILVDRRSGKGRVLSGRPGGDQPSEVVQLWDEMQRHFAGELHPPIIVAPGEQVGFDAQWAVVANQSPASSPGT
jgi:hypothetical protein